MQIKSKNEIYEELSKLNKDIKKIEDYINNLENKDPLKKEIIEKCEKMKINLNFENLRKSNFTDFMNSEDNLKNFESDSLYDFEKKNGSKIYSSDIFNFQKKNYKKISVKNFQNLKTNFRNSSIDKNLNVSDKLRKNDFSTKNLKTFDFNKNLKNQDFIYSQKQNFRKLNNNLNYSEIIKRKNNSEIIKRQTNSIKFGIPLKTKILPRNINYQTNKKKKIYQNPKGNSFKNMKNIIVIKKVQKSYNFFEKKIILNSSKKNLLNQNFKESLNLSRKKTLEKNINIYSKNPINPILLNKNNQILLNKNNFNNYNKKIFLNQSEYLEKKNFNNKNHFLNKSDFGNFNRNRSYTLNQNFGLNNQNNIKIIRTKRSNSHNIKGPVLMKRNIF